MHGHIVMNIDACSYRNLHDDCLHDDCLHDDCLHDDCLLLLLFLNESTRSIDRYRGVMKQKTTTIDCRDIYP
jgi:hypothetical protein